MKSTTINWRRGFGIEEDTPITFDEIQVRYDELCQQADSYDDMRKYGMYVALHTFLDSAKRELARDDEISFT